MALSPEFQALLDRLNGYNGNAWHPTSNPLGFDRGGNQQGTFTAMLKDVAAFGATITTLTGAAANDAEATAADRFQTGQDRQAAGQSASDAAEHAEAAAGSVIAAGNLLDAFDDRYLGAKAADPAVDNDTNPLIIGALYFSTAARAMKVWNGAAWQVLVPAASDFLLKTGGTMTGRIVFGAGQTMPIVRTARTGDVTIVEDQGGRLIEYTSGTFTQTFAPAATLGAGWPIRLRNNGTGVITLDPDGTELIDNLSSIRLYPRESILVVCTGTGFRTYGRETRVLIADYFVPSPVTSVDFEAFATDTELKFVHFDVYGIDPGTTLALHLKKNGVYLDSGYIRQTLVGNGGSASASNSSGATSAVDHSPGALTKGTVLARAMDTHVRSESHADNRVSVSHARHPTLGMVEGLRFAAAVGTISEAQFRIHGER